MLAGAVASRAPVKTAAFKMIRGLGKFLPYNGALFLLGGMALIGLPPMNGFISKLALVQSGIDVQSWLALGLAVGAGAITLLYMMRTWQHIFQREPAETTKTKATGDSVLAPALLLGICVGLGIYAAPLVELAGLVVVELRK